MSYPFKKRRFVVLDRDGTVIYECHYLSDPYQVELLPNAVDAMLLLKEMGFGFIMITNQSGISRGYYDLTRLELINQRLSELLLKEGVRLDGIYFCPHLPEDNCYCRKPEPGLLLQAAQKHEFDPEDSYLIGDRECDIELGKRVGAITFLVRTGYGEKVERDSFITPDYVVDDLWAAAEMIRQLENQREC